MCVSKLFERAAPQGRDNTRASPAGGTNEILEYNKT